MAGFSSSSKMSEVSGPPVVIATELAEHGKTAADKAYAWAKDEAQAAVARANEVFEQCKKAYEEAQKVFEDLKGQLGGKAEKAGGPVVEQAKAAHDMAKQLLDRHSDPSDDQIRHYLSGNLCRCGTYPEIIAAVKLAARKRKEK